MLKTCTGSSAEIFTKLFFLLRTSLTKTSIYHGTAVDTSLLIDHLGSYILNGPRDPSITQHLVMGISLGGHSAWQVLFNEPRVTAGIVIIGCPDYISKWFDFSYCNLISITFMMFLGVLHLSVCFDNNHDFLVCLLTLLRLAMELWLENWHEFHHTDLKDLN